MRISLLVVALAFAGCVENSGAEGGSLAGMCADNFDCAAGYSCEAGLCVRPGCQSDDDCSLGFLCIDSRCADRFTSG